MIFLGIFDKYLKIDFRSNKNKYSHNIALRQIIAKKKKDCTYQISLNHLIITCLANIFYLF